MGGRESSTKCHHAAACPFAERAKARSHTGHQKAKDMHIHAVSRPRATSCRQLWGRKAQQDPPLVVFKGNHMRGRLNNRSEFF